MDPLLVFTFRHVTPMGGRVPLLREQEGHWEREREEGQISSDWSAGEERERKREGFKQWMRRTEGEGCVVVYPVTG